MLGWERWTLTHSSVGGAVAGLGAAKASSVAAVVALADGDAEAGPEADADADGTSAALLRLADGDADGGSLLGAGGSVLEVDWLADDVPEGDDGGDVDFAGEGEGEGDVDRDGDVDGAGALDADGEDEEVPGGGRAWHALAMAGAGWEAACALPAMPRARKAPLSRVAAATLTCAKRMRIACLR
jgi:hypothetical protein